MIEEAERLILRMSALGSIGRYQLEAALQSAHVCRRRSGKNNWEDILHLYDTLSAIASSPVVAINRALAVAEVHGAAAGLDALEAVTDRRITEYLPDWAARAELFSRTGASAEAHKAYEVAIGLERDPAVTLFLRKLQSALSI